ncbi:MAG TPA: NAD(P)(+) transhydrogenase (Re/Si-specific) subunit beta [Gaiellaceae bacterium]|nr:NAD(P)(+) transhydrogenase (Re/Si-specific) subunit beta [Gaiellaceae bacterium]
MSQNTANLLYLIPMAAFILALHFLSSPRHARLGNQIGAIGMLVAIIVTLLKEEVVTGWWIMLAGGIVGTVIGVVGARTVKMTAMPQMVALFNGVGGGAAALISVVEFHGVWANVGEVGVERGVATVFSALIGSISFAGSMVAFGKLQELISGRPITYPGTQFVNAAVFVGAIGVGTWAMVDVRFWALVAMVGLAALFGVLFVLPIGGADMPVVISLLNAFTGLAAAATGFVLHSNILIVSGALVGASGTLLTMLMGRAMNRSIANVLFGAFGKVVAGPAMAASGADGASVRSTTADDVAVMLAYAQRVVVVPGYGLAVAQAQHEVRQLAELLEAKGIDVKYAIHPVAGRMPGHMNVLLAEANVPYDQLKEMDEINPDFPRTDVALVIGANDVTNPAARNNPGSPIYGMPILNVDQAQQVIVLKRSMRPGFAGIDNELYTEPKTAMLFGDAKESVQNLIQAVKSV